MKMALLAKRSTLRSYPSNLKVYCVLCRRTARLRTTIAVGTLHQRWRGEFDHRSTSNRRPGNDGIRCQYYQCVTLHLLASPCLGNLSDVHEMEDLAPGDFTSSLPTHDPQLFLYPVAPIDWSRERRLGRSRTRELFRIHRTMPCFPYMAPTHTHLCHRQRSVSLSNHNSRCSCLRKADQHMCFYEVLFAHDMLFYRMVSTMRGVPPTRLTGQVVDYLEISNTHDATSTGHFPAQTTLQPFYQVSSTTIY